MTHRFLQATLATLSGTILCGIVACSLAPSDQRVRAISDQPATPAERVAAQRSVLPPGQPAASQETFATPDAAVDALVMACDAKDHAAMKKIFGPAAADYSSGDTVADGNDFEAFADATSARAMLEEKNATTTILHIGKDDWTFPIPIAQTKDGRWYFDTVAGEIEVLARRIGENENSAIGVCHTYVDAQREYAAMDRNGDGVLDYAMRLKSRPGQHDGLYWPADSAASGSAANASPSPFGPLIAEASSEGYAPISGSKSNPTAYHGYYFHILTAQGPDAPNGAYSYIINGHMIAGFALVAYPAEYGKSGIMTFIVSYNGRVYQKDLGAGTAQTAAAMMQYNPDKSWALLKD